MRREPTMNWPSQLVGKRGLVSRGQSHRRVFVSPLRVDGRLGGEPNMLVDQLTKRDSLRLVRDWWLPDTLAHGAFLRWLATHEDRFALDEVSPFVLLAAAVRQARRRPGASLPVQRQDVGSVVRGPRSRRGSS